MSESLVLIAEDDRRQAEVLRRYLEAAGYAVSVAHDGVNALHQAQLERPALVVLDVMMPGLDGLEVCRKLRARSAVPILMVTARTTEEDLVTGLEVGADDYLAKPYSPRELTARVQALLRRSTSVDDSAEAPVYRVGGLRLDSGTRRTTMDGAEIACTPAEFAILAAMAQRPNQVFTRAQLLHYTQGFDRSSTERAIDVHVVNLRRKLETDRRQPALLQTVRGVGYRLSDGVS